MLDNTDHAARHSRFIPETKLIPSRRSTALVALALVTALAGCKKEEQAGPTTELATVERRTIVINAEATGVVEPINVIEVKSRASGQIIDLPVETGTLVAPGDLLVQLDTREMRNNLNQAVADQRAAQARLEVAQAQRRRTQELFNQQVVTSQELESSSLELENAQASLVRAQMEVDLAQQRLDDATVRAPSRGTIIDRLVSPGQVIVSATSSASGGTTLMNMADLSRVRVRAMVNETDIGQVRVGLSARVVVDAYPNRPFIGEVEKVEPQAVVDQSVTMFPVLITLDNQEGLLMPGMNGEVSVLVDRRENVLAVPVDAIRTMQDAVPTAVMLGMNREAVQESIRTQMAALMGGPQRPAGDTAATGSAPVQPSGDTRGASAGGAPMVLAQGPAGPGGPPPSMRQGGANFRGMMGGARRGNGGTPAIVFVAKSDVDFEPRVVLMGVSDYDYTEIIRGLEEGERVALLASIALQAQRQEMQDRIRSRTSLPGLERNTGGSTSTSGGR